MNTFRALILQISKQCYIQNHLRYNSSKENKKYLIHLKQRTLLRLTSNDVLPFLQGLTTNDMKHFKDDATCVYSTLLNTKGRVLYDVIIYKIQQPDVFYIECDSSIILNLIKHLKTYKLKKVIDIEIMENSMKVWSLYDTNIISQNYNYLQNSNKYKTNFFSYGVNINTPNKLTDNIYIYNDPRIFQLGLRILTKSNVSYVDIIQHLGSNILIEKKISNYTVFRYKLGIAEGVQDLSFGISFPLEINCDYLNGVSFHKGCYIGQEVTARIYYTGIVRKRLMPLILNINNVNIDCNEKIVNEDGKVVGKIRRMEGTVGLGLMRISEALVSKTLFVRDYSLQIIRPLWWPQVSNSKNIET